MKIGFLITSFSIGGIEKVFITLANYFAKENEIDLIVCKNEGELKKLKDASVGVIDLGGIKVTKLLFPLIRVLKQRKYDIFISGGDIVNIIVGMTKYFGISKTKLVLTQHNFFNSESIFFINKSITKFLLKLAFSKADQVIAVSEDVKSWCKQELKSKNVIEIQNPIDMDRVKILENEEISFILKKPYAVFAGRLSIVKNIPLLINAFKILKDSNIDLNLIILGKGTEEATLKKMVLDMQLSDRVLFVGSVPNVFPYIKDSEMLLMSSTSEAFSVTVIEAFSLGIPVISTKTQGSLEIMASLGSKYFVNSFSDPKEYAAKIREILNEKINRKELINITKQYTIQAIGECYITCFKKLLESK